MKLSVFKKLIREVIREELDYSFSRLRKELNEIVVKSNTSNMSKARSKSTEDMSMKSLVKASTKNVATPKTTNKVLNKLLEETAQSDDWKTVEGEGEAEVQSVQDNTEQLPEHLANAFTKDYSKIMKKVEEKDRFKNGS